MGFHDLIRDITRPIKKIEKNIKRELRKQQNAIVRTVEDVVEPIEKKIHGLEKVFVTIQRESEKHFNDILSPVLNTVEDSVEMLEDLQNNVQAIPGTFNQAYKILQKTIQQVLDQLKFLNPSNIWAEIKGTLSIIIPALIAAYVLLTIGPQLLINILL